METFISQFVFGDMLASILHPERCYKQEEVCGAVTAMAAPHPMVLHGGG